MATTARQRALRRKRNRNLRKIATFQRRRVEALATAARAQARRIAALARGDAEQARNALEVRRKYRERAQQALRDRRESLRIAQEALEDLRRERQRASQPCPRARVTFKSVKNWFTRPKINPRLIVLHSTESGPLSGRAVSGYLSHGGTQADSHVVIDTDGTEFRLVPDGRKAWTQAYYNSVSLSIEQVGRASVDNWPEPLLRATAKRIACWSRKYDIPIRHVGPSGRGVTTHKQLGAAGGGHVDPGPHYPLERVLALAREYR